MSSLQLPSFLHGSRSALSHQLEAEARRCARHYALHGTFPPPLELLPVAADAEVFTDELVDLRPSQPAWRLYGVWELTTLLCDSLGVKDRGPVRDAYEAASREAPWSALYHATAELAPQGPARTALRLQALLHSWDSLHHGRYLHKRLQEFLSLEPLVLASCGWLLEAWCPEGEPSIRSCLEVASQRLLRATREDSVRALLRQLPSILSQAHDVQHPEVVLDPSFWREQLATLDDASFERVSTVCPAWVLQRLYLWDGQLGQH